MGILYNCNEKMPIIFILEAIFNKIFTIDTIESCVGYISIIAKNFVELNNNIILLFDNIRKVITFK